MKILAIRGSNIASLTEFDIDFQAEPLRSAGIFAITGSTGAGKSSLLDAMCLALYQRAPRLDDLSGRETKVESRFGEIGLADIRNLLRRGCDTGHAECDFLGGDGRAYRARWGYRAAKKKGAAVQEEMTLVCIDDQRVLVAASGKKGEYQASIERLVGLKYDEFMRTVLLAQGRFAQFLKSDENQRADLLEKLTGTEVYGRISKKIFEKTREARDQVAAIERDLDGLALLDEAARESRQARHARLESQVPRQEGIREGLRRFLDGLERLDSLRRLRTEIARESEATRAKTESVAKDLADAKRRWDRVEVEKIERQPEIARARDLDAALEVAGGAVDQRAKLLEESARSLEQVDNRLRELRQSSVALADAIAADREWLETRRSKLEPLAGNWNLWSDKLRQADRYRQELSSLGEARARSDAALRDAALRCEQVAGQLAEIALPEGLGADELHAALEAMSTRRQALQAALPVLELRGEIRDRDRKLSERESALPELETRCAVSEAKWSTAKRLHEETRVALSGDVEHLRAGLQDGSPCPVCGSGDHPWAKGLPALDAMLERHAREESAARLEYESVRGELDGIRALVESQRQILTESRARLGALVLAKELAEEIETVADPVEWAKLRVAELAEDGNAAMARLKDLRRCDELRSRLAEARSKRDLAQAASAGDAEKVSAAEKALEECLASLDAPFGSGAWRARWMDNSAFAEQVTVSVKEYLARGENLDRNLRKAEPLEAAISTQAEMVEVRRSETARCEAEALAARAELAELRRRREAVLDGCPVSEVEERLEARLREARDLHEATRLVYDREVVNGAALEGRATEALRQEGKESRELLELEGEHFPGAPASDDPADRAPMVRQKLAEAEAEIAGMRRETAELSVELERDRRDRERAGDLVRKLSSVREVHGEWSLLCDQIGSADGKLFKRIAQQFTLEILLEEANAQLLTVAPRYSLRMLGNSMHFGVLDHESFEELRPVQTLSGGESFLVSLGLALGLSRMAGGDLSVESLFIDEGFGTLDGETLQGVMVALSSLHAQGRKVGLITHVEEMKEQIPVRIEVVKLGQGASRVEVRG